MRVPYYIGDPKRDPNLENYPHNLGVVVALVSGNGLCYSVLSGSSMCAAPTGLHSVTMMSQKYCKSKITWGF